MKPKQTAASEATPANAVAPASPLSAEPASGEAPLRLKLKPKATTAEVPAESTLEEPAPAEPSSGETIEPLPPFVTPTENEASTLEAEAPPLILTKGGKPPPIKKRRPPRKPPVVLLLVLLVALLGGGGYVVWVFYLKVPVPEPVIVRRSAPPPAPAEAPPETASIDTVQPTVPQSVVGQAIAKARDAATAYDEQMQELVEPTTPAPAPESAPPVEVSVAASSQTRISKDITVTTSTMLASVEASPAFRSLVAEMRISGVFQGSPARALIDGRTFSEGEVIDTGLGVSFSGVDPDNKLLIFRDASGAIVKRKY